MVQLIPLNGVGTCIRRGAKYLKSGATVQGPRRDARPGALRSLLTVGPKGHVHIRHAHSRSALARPSESTVGVITFTLAAARRPSRFKCPCGSAELLRPCKRN